MLDDTQTAVGPPDDMRIIATKGWGAANPEAAGWLKNFKITPELLSDLMLKIQTGGKGQELATAKQWAADNKAVSTPGSTHPADLPIDVGHRARLIGARRRSAGPRRVTEFLLDVFRAAQASIERSLSGFEQQMRTLLLAISRGRMPPLCCMSTAPESMVDLQVPHIPCPQDDGGVRPAA